MRGGRSIAAVLIGTVTIGTVTMVTGAIASPAHAADPQFRYWTYWTGTADGWQFAPVGPAFRDAADGVVEGWRLAVTGVSATVPPRLAPGPAFADACSGVPDSPDTVRVAVVIDFGTANDAPAGHTPPAPEVLCTHVPTGATGFDVLREVVEIRSERGLVCGLSGYPRTGCAERVEDPAAEAPQADAADEDPRGADRPSNDAVESTGTSGSTQGQSDGGSDAGTNPDGTNVDGTNTDGSDPDGSDPDSMTSGAVVPDDAVAGDAAPGGDEGPSPSAADEMQQEVAGDPTYPAEPRSGDGGAAASDAGPAPEVAAVQPGADTNPLSSPWLAVPALILVVGLALTAWRRSRSSG